MLLLKGSRISVLRQNVRSLWRKIIHLEATWSKREAMEEARQNTPLKCTQVTTFSSQAPPSTAHSLRTPQWIDSLVKISVLMVQSPPNSASRWRPGFEHVSLRREVGCDRTHSQTVAYSW